MPEEIVIPDKPAFKAAEVCELLKVPPYVLKSWENEFRDLGVSKSVSGPRVYRREDVARALRIRHLVLSEGLTLAGVRRRLEEESGAASPEDALIAEIVAASSPARSAAGTAAGVDRAQWRERVERLRSGLREILDVLSRPIAPAPVAARAPAARPIARATRRSPREAPSARTAADPAPVEDLPPARDLVVEPEPAEPSLFAEADSDLAADAERGGEGMPRARRKAAGRGV